MNKGYSIIFLISILIIASSCNSGYYAHLPRVKKTEAKSEQPQKTIITAQKVQVELVETASTAAELMVEDALPVTEVVTETKHKAEAVHKRVEEVKIHTQHIPLIKQKVQSRLIPKDKTRNGYPDSSLWFFYVGVFLMVIGLIFIIIPTLGFGVGIPFLITGAIIMIMGLFLA